MQIRQGYAQLEQQRYGRSWTREEVALGFVGDIGDLVKLVMAQKSHKAILLVKGHDLAYNMTRHTRMERQEAHEWTRRTAIGSIHHHSRSGD
jgi:hypothetical protein